MQKGNICRKLLIHKMKYYLPLLFLFLICGITLLIKIGPIRSQNIKNSDAQELVNTENPRLQNGTSRNLPTYTSSPIIIFQMLHMLKSGTSRPGLIEEQFRLKSLCSNAYVSIQRNFIAATTNEEKAFNTKPNNNNLIEMVRLGNHAFLRSPSLNLYICYDQNGFLRPTALEQVNELCIFKVVIKQNPLYREFFSASQRFSASTIQFKTDGLPLRAQLSIPLDIAKRTIKDKSNGLYNTILNYENICSHLSGLILHKTQMDTIYRLEDQIKAEASNNLYNLRLEYINEQKLLQLRELNEVTFPYLFRRPNYQMGNHRTSANIPNEWTTQRNFPLNGVQIFKVNLKNGRLRRPTGRRRNMNRGRSRIIFPVK